MSGQSHTENSLDNVANNFADDSVFEAVDVPYILPGHPLFPEELKACKVASPPSCLSGPVVHQQNLNHLPVTAALGLAISPIHDMSRFQSILYRKKEDKVQIKNETDTTICIVCTQDLVSVLDNGGAGLNAGPAGVDLRLDIVKALVGVKEIKSVLKLGPNELQDISAPSKYTIVSVFSIQGDAMKLLFKSALLKRGRRLTVEQRDVEYALNDHELVVLDQ